MSPKEQTQASQPSAPQSSVAGACMPRHVAIIMDGNGRWAPTASPRPPLTPE